MATPHKCPVCNGTGLVSVPPGVAGDVETFTTASFGPWECRPCEGEGVLWRADDDGPSPVWQEPVYPVPTPALRDGTGYVVAPGYTTISNNHQPNGTSVTLSFQDVAEAHARGLITYTAAGSA